MSAALFLVALGGAQPANLRATVADKAEIAGVVSHFENDWSKCDAKALSSLWTADGDFQSPYGFRAKGRAEIEKFYRNAFDSGYCGSRGTGKIGNIRFVRKNVAIVDGVWDIQGARRQNGQTASEEKGFFIAVVVKQRGVWLIVAQREMIPATLR